MAKLREFLPAAVAVAKLDVEKRKNVGQAIADYARDHRFDLIAMPTHGYGTLRRLVVGSTTAAVLGESPVALWTFTPDRAPREAGVDRIVCALELDDAAADVLGEADSLAKQFGAKLTVVHALPSVDESSLNWAMDPPTETSPEEADDRLKAIIAAVQADCEVMIECGRPAPVLKRIAKEVEADMVIAGRRSSSSDGQGALGPTTYEIVRTSPCPVWIASRRAVRRDTRSATPEVSAVASGPESSS
jgi:nucleotide-binding universal stress UspA family protein